MDVSPKTLREVEFREKLRGYHPEDVDQFLERVAAGIEALQDRLRQTTERAVHAEELAAATGESDEALRRTLVLAQRTADAAVEEARSQATAIVDEAAEKARGIVEDARRKAAAMATEAQAQLRDDIAVLEAARTRLADDVRAFEDWIEHHHNEVSAALADALNHLKAGVRVSLPVPEAEALDIPPAPVIDAPVAGDVADIADVEETAAEEEPSPVASEPETAAPAEGSPQETVEAAPFDHDEDDEAEHLVADEVGDDADDPFMAELRRAVTDDEPLGPRDDDEPTPIPANSDRSFYPDDGGERGRFGSRLRRRR